MPRNAAFAHDAQRLEQDWGIVLMAQDYMPDELRHNWEGALRIAMDAQPGLVSSPDAGIPAMFTSYVDPEVVRVLQSPNRGAQILGEVKKGSWIDETAFFPVIENTGEVASYGDFSANGRSDANPNFVQRQSYLYQTHIEYGDREAERAGAARLNWVSELQISAAKTLDKFSDYIYHFGVAGLQNYGLLNDPQLPAALTPATKAAGGVKWVNNNQIIATANEVYADFQALYNELATRSGANIDENTPFKFVYPNTVATGMTATNEFGLTVKALIKESFPNVEYVVDARYATTSGNEVQLIALEYGGAKTGYCAFNEKMRDHRLVPDTSSFRQKKTAGSWGAVIRYPMAVASMLGV